jgi:hypothetical protein
LAISEQLLEEIIFELIKKASIELPLDVQNALASGYAREENPAAKGQLGAILNNCRIAREKQVGLCQDTGMPMFYADLGLNCRLGSDQSYRRSSTPAECDQSSDEAEFRYEHGLGHSIYSLGNDQWVGLSGSHCGPQRLWVGISSLSVLGCY